MSVEFNEQDLAWFDLRRRDVRDAVTVLSLASLVLAGTVIYATTKLLTSFSGDDGTELPT